jgi:hypothetical protein
LFQVPLMIGDKTLLWKVYNIESGKILKAGFDNEDDAKDWLEERAEKLADEHVVEEMDTDEIEEWKEENEAEEVEEKEEEADEDDDFLDDDDEEESEETSLDELYDDEDDDDL